MVEFLALTLTPLVNEIFRFVEDFPKLAERPRQQLQRPRRVLRPPGDPGRHPRLDRRHHRRPRPGRRGRRPARSTCRSCCRLITGAGSLHRRRLRLPHPAGLGRLPAQGPGRPRRPRSTAPCRRPGGSTAGRSSRRSSASSASGCAASSSWGFAVGVAHLRRPAHAQPSSSTRSSVATRSCCRSSPGVLELVPIIGPIIAAVPAVLLAATAGPEAAIVAALVLYTLVQQVENNFLVPKIQGDAVRAASRPRSCSRSSSAARWPGCSARSWRCPSRPPSATSSATSSGGWPGRDRRRWPRRWRPTSAIGPVDADRRRPRMPDRIDPYKILQVDSEAEDEVIQAAYRRLARKYHPDLAATPRRPTGWRRSTPRGSLIGDPMPAVDMTRTARSSHTRRSAPPRFDHVAATPPAPKPDPHRRRPTARDSLARLDVGPLDPRRRLRRVDARAEGLGAAGPPPGRPSGSVLNFGRYAGWSLGEVGRQDLEYIEWLDRAPIGRHYREEIDGILRRTGRRRSAAAEASDRRGLFRRR